MAFIDIIDLKVCSHFRSHSHLAFSHCRQKTCVGRRGSWSWSLSWRPCVVMCLWLLLSSLTLDTSHSRTVTSSFMTYSFLSSENSKYDSCPACPWFELNSVLHYVILSHMNVLFNKNLMLNFMLRLLPTLVSLVKVKSVLDHCFFLSCLL